MKSSYYPKSIQISQYKKNAIQGLVTTFQDICDNLNQLLEKDSLIYQQFLHSKTEKLFRNPKGLKVLISSFKKTYLTTQKKVEQNSEVISQQSLQKMNQVISDKRSNNYESNVYFQQSKSEVNFDTEKNILNNDENKIVSAFFNSYEINQNSKFLDEIMEIQYPKIKIYEDDIQKDNDDKPLKRGPYKSYTDQQKNLAVLLYKEGGQITKISQQLNIPCKNIKRWAENGIQRKRGAGRKVMFPQLQQQLNKIIQKKYAKGSPIYIEVIQQLALSLVKNEKNSFKASKGWVFNFAQRFDIDKKYQLI